jgi:acyl carrier protein
MTTLETLRRIISETLSVQPEEITPESNLRVDLGMDSLDEVELVMAVEEDFGVDIDDDDAVNFATVGDIIKFVDSQAD